MTPFQVFGETVVASVEVCIKTKHPYQAVLLGERRSHERVPFAVRFGLSGPHRARLLVGETLAFLQAIRSLNLSTSIPSNPQGKLIRDHNRIMVHSFRAIVADRTGQLDLALRVR